MRANGARRWFVSRKFHAEQFNAGMLREFSSGREQEQATLEPDD
jgi:hypothetical protein